MNNGISAERKPKATRQQRPKLSKEELKAFFDWRHAWLSRLFEHPEVKANPRLFMLGWFLAQHFDYKNRSCFPSRETIAAAIGVSPWSVTQLTRKLASMRFVNVKRRGRKDSAIYVGVIPSNTRHETGSIGSTQDQATNEEGKKLGAATPDVGCGQLERLAGPNTNISNEHRFQHIDGAHAPSEESLTITESSDALFEARPTPDGRDHSYTEETNLAHRVCESEIGDDWEPDLTLPEDFDYEDPNGEDGDNEVDSSEMFLEDLGEIPSEVDVSDRAQLRAYVAGLDAAYLGRPRNVPCKYVDNSEAWLIGFDDYERRRADGRLPLCFAF